MDAEKDTPDDIAEFSLAPRKLIGERIRHLWISSGEPQDEFVKSLGVSTVTLSNYMTGKRKPDSEFLVAIKKKLNICLDWLLAGDGPMRPGEPAQAAPDSVTLPAQEIVCTRCAKLEARLDSMELEHRELTLEARKIIEEMRQVTAENREMTTELRKLWEKNAALREENATLRERQYQRSGQSDSEPMGHAG